MGRENKKKKKEKKKVKNPVMSELIKVFILSKDDRKKWCCLGLKIYRNNKKIKKNEQRKG